MFSRIFNCILFAALLLNAQSRLAGALGAQYYVSGAGDDRNSGASPDAPFRTIQKAANLAQPGDMINVMDGEYTNACASCSVVDITRSGTADNWIVFRAYPGHKPVLRYNGWHDFAAFKSVVAPGQLNMLQPIINSEGHLNGFSWLAVLLGYPILGIWYWCADQTHVQRVLGARTLKDGQNGALFAGFLKITPVFLMVFPGIIGYVLWQKGAIQLANLAGTDRPDYNTMLPALVSHLIPVGLRGLIAFRIYFGHDTDADEQLLESICGAYGGRIQLTSLDGSGLFTLPAFLRAYKRLARFPFESIESPVERDDIETIAEARRAIDHPVSEHIRSLEYALRCIKLRAVDIFNISITVAGGITGMMKLFALAEAANIECLIGTTQELSVATAAQAHVGAAAPRLDYASDPVGPCLYTADVVREPARFERGW